MRTISCDAERLYRKGGLYKAEGIVSTQDSRVLGHWAGNVYGAYSYERPLPANVFAAEPSVEETVRRWYRELNQQYPVGASTDAFVLERAVLYDRALYVVLSNQEVVRVYETSRVNDRAWTQQLDEEKLKNCASPSRRDVTYVYCGSVGSENYAHWMVDDLTKIKGVLEYVDLDKAILLLDGYTQEMNEVRVATIRALVGTKDKPLISFINRNTPYFFEKLTYISPVTFNPVLKNPESLAFVYDRLHRRSAQSPKRLFVGRNALWRKLLNPLEVEEFFLARSFSLVTMDGSMPFAEQVETFSNAEIVVGVIGASMVNTIFCNPGTRLFYLAGVGFTDPWFWDLAAVRGHEYSVCFGEPWKPEMPRLSSFRMGAAELAALSAVL